MGSPWRQVLQHLVVPSDRGLDAQEVQRRHQIYGLNRLREAKKKNPWLILANQFRSLIVLLLVVAAALSLLFRDWSQGLAIVVVIALNVAIGFFTELRAFRSVEALQRLGAVNARVRRNARVQ